MCPRDEGVRVRSTPRKVLEALRAGSPAGLKGHWFLGEVRYLSQDDLLQEITNVIHQYGNRVFEVPTNRANLLLLKRDAFSHEGEVRVIFVQEHPEPRPPIIQVSIDPSDVFEEISFDPRLEMFEREERKTVARSLGYKGEIAQSDLYVRTLLEVNIDHPAETNGNADRH